MSGAALGLGVTGSLGSCEPMDLHNYCPGTCKGWDKSSHPWRMWTHGLNFLGLPLIAAIKASQFTHPNWDKYIQFSKSL